MYCRKASTGSDGISSGNKSVGRDVSRDDLLDDCRRRSSRNDAAAAPPVRRRLSNSVSICSFHPTSSTSTGNASSSIPVPPATVSKYSKLRAKSKSFFRKEPRANSADTRCNLNKRHSSHEPLYANNNSGRGSNSSDPDYGMLDGETYSSGGHRVLYRSQSKFLDSDYLMEEITHTYKPNPVRRTSQGQSGSSQNSMSSKYSSRSVFDLRNSKSSHAGGENNMSYHAKAGEGTTAGVTTLEGKKRMVPLRKLLSCDSSAKMRSQSICVPRSLALEHCNRSGSSSNFRFPSSSSSDAAVVAAASAASTAAGGGSLHHLASIPTTPATTSASCKPISKMLLDSLNQRLREESIDLTVDPYSDVGGFCGIPAALVQRYADESAHDVYDVADALDHLRLESLLMQGRRGVSERKRETKTTFQSPFPTTSIHSPSTHPHSLSHSAPSVALIPWHLHGPRTKARLLTWPPFFLLLLLPHLHLDSERLPGGLVFRCYAGRDDVSAGSTQVAHLNRPLHVRAGIAAERLVPHGLDWQHERGGHGNDGNPEEVASEDLH